MLSPAEFISILFPISSPQTTQSTSDSVATFATQNNSRSNSLDSSITSVELDNSSNISTPTPPSPNSSPSPSFQSAKLSQSSTMNQMVVLDIRYFSHIIYYLFSYY